MPSFRLTHAGPASVAACSVGEEALGRDHDDGTGLEIDVADEGVHERNFDSLCVESLHHEPVLGLTEHHVDNGAQRTPGGVDDLETGELIRPELVVVERATLRRRDRQ